MAYEILPKETTLYRYIPRGGIPFYNAYMNIAPDVKGMTTTIVIFDDVYTTGESL